MEKEKKEIYIPPTVKVIRVELEDSITQGSTITIDPDPGDWEVDEIVFEEDIWLSF